MARCMNFKEEMRDDSGFVMGGTGPVVSGGSGYTAGDIVSMSIGLNGSVIGSAAFMLTLTGGELPTFTLANSSVPASAT